MYVTFKNKTTMSLAYKQKFMSVVLKCFLLHGDLELLMEVGNHFGKK